jgi:hypothetical protein
MLLCYVGEPTTTAAAAAAAAAAAVTCCDVWKASQLADGSIVAVKVSGNHVCFAIVVNQQQQQHHQHQQQLMYQCMCRGSS